MHRSLLRSFLLLPPILLFTKPRCFHTSVFVCQSNLRVIFIVVLPQHAGNKFLITMDDFDVVQSPQPKSKGRGKAGAKAKKTSDKSCLVPDCEEKVVNQKVWCSGHACSWTGLCFQCEEQGGEQLERLKLLKEKGMEKEKGEAVGAYSLKNPPHRKYKKRQLFDIVAYSKKKWASTQIAHNDNERPMTKEAFRAYCTNELGLEPGEMEAWWKELDEDPRTERDNGGFRGREQLWIPLGQERQRSRLRGVTDEVQEKSKDMKGYTEEDVQVLTDHALRQKTKITDEYLTSGFCEERQAVLKRSAAKAELDKPEGDSQSQPSKKQRIRRKGFDADRDTAKYHASMKEDLERLSKKIVLLNGSYEKALEEIQKTPDSVVMADLPLAGYLRKLQFRYQVFLNW